jgi:hypothetical protein
MKLSKNDSSGQVAYVALAAGMIEKVKRRPAPSWQEFIKALLRALSVLHV